MATTIQQIHPVAHLPLVLGVLRRLEVASVIDRLIPPHPAHGLSCGRGVEALVLAILDGHHALYKQVPRSLRRNELPVKLIDGTLLMGHEHLASAFVELPQVAQAASCPNRVLHHPPKTFNGVEVVPTMGW